MPRSCANVVKRLETCGAVEVVLTPRGGLIRIRDQDAFDRAVGSMCPDGLFVEIDDLQDRAASVMALGDAKAIRCGPCQGVFLRSTKPNVCVSSIDGALNVPVGEMTAIAGGAALLLEGDEFWTCEGLVATVENEEAFWRHHLVLPEVDLAIYTHGKMSDRLVTWLSSPPMNGCRYIHWGDYDPMGVIEYCRLAAACPGRVRFHVPETWTFCFRAMARQSLSRNKLICSPTCMTDSTMKSSVEWSTFLRITVGVWNRRYS